MCFVSIKGEFYFKLPMNNFPSSQVKAKTCPRVVSYRPVKWVQGLGKAGGSRP